MVRYEFFSFMLLCIFLIHRKKIRLFIWTNLEYRKNIIITILFKQRILFIILTMYNMIYNAVVLQYMINTYWKYLRFRDAQLLCNKLHTFLDHNAVVHSRRVIIHIHTEDVHFGHHHRHW